MGHSYRWRRGLILLFCVIFSSSLLCFSARADDVYQIVIKKQEEKKSYRWSLDEWLETKERFRWMDLWLAMHSSAPYEFYLGGDIKFSSGQGSSLNYRANFAAFASIVGLGLEREADPEKWNALFYLRVFGYHAQGTNITFHVGVRNQTQPVVFRSAFAGLSATIYIRKVFGVEGTFRHLFPATVGDSALTYQGNQYEGNAFIDFSYIRVYAGYLNQSDDSGERTSYYAGTRFFF